MIGKSNLVEQT